MNGFSNQPMWRAYPLDAFLLTVREAGFEVIHNVQAPDALVGMSLINAIAMACQGLIDVKLPTAQIRPVSQYLVTVNESGDRKTTVYHLVLKPFHEADKRALASHDLKMKQYQTEIGSWQAKNKGICRAISKAASNGESTAALDTQLAEHAQLKPKTPHLRYFLREDITAKAIMEALQGDGESIAITTDEGNVLFQSAPMSHLGLLNRLWDSPEMLPLDRSGYEQTVAMNPRVSVSIMTQSAPLKAYLDKRGSVARGSGHWARYLVGWPYSTQGYRKVQTNELVWQHLPKFHARARVLLQKYQAMIESGKVEREIVEFSDDAKARWFDLAVRTESLLRQGEYLSDINDFASKIMEILARLAAAMHYFGGEDGKITLDTLERAFTIVQWHIEEFKSLFSPQFVMPQDQIDAHKVVTWLRTRIWCGPNSDTVILKNNVLRNGPVRNRSHLNAALDYLTAQGGVQVFRASDPRDRKTYVRLMNEFLANVGA